MQFLTLFKHVALPAAWTEAAYRWTIYDDVTTWQVYNGAFRGHQGLLYFCWAIIHKPAKELNQRAHAQDSEWCYRRINMLRKVVAVSCVNCHSYSFCWDCTVDGPVCVATEDCTLRFYQRLYLGSNLTLRLVVDTKFQNKKHQQQYSPFTSTSSSNYTSSLRSSFNNKHLPHLPLGPLMLQAAGTLNTDSVLLCGWRTSTADLCPLAQLSNGLCVDSELGCSRWPPLVSLSGPIIASGLLESRLLLVHRQKWHHRLLSERTVIISTRRSCDSRRFFVCN